MDSEQVVSLLNQSPRPNKWEMLWMLWTEGKDSFYVYGGCELAGINRSVQRTTQTRIDRFR